MLWCLFYPKHVGKRHILLSAEVSTRWLSYIDEACWFLFSSVLQWSAISQLRPSFNKDADRSLLFTNDDTVKEVMWSTVFAVCLFVKKITQIAMNGFVWNFHGRLERGYGRNNKIFVIIHSESHVYPTNIQVISCIHKSFVAALLLTIIH